MSGLPFRPLPQPRPEYPQVTHSLRSVHRIPLGPPDHSLETESLQQNL